MFNYDQFTFILPCKLQVVHESRSTIGNIATSGHLLRTANDVTQRSRDLAGPSSRISLPIFQTLQLLSWPPFEQYSYAWLLHGSHSLGEINIMRDGGTRDTWALRWRAEPFIIWALWFASRVPRRILFDHKTVSVYSGIVSACSDDSNIRFSFRPRSVVMCVCMWWLFCFNLRTFSTY